MLHLLICLLALVHAGVAPTQCLPYTTRCASTCTQGAINGSEVTPGQCPGISEYGFTRPRCDVCRSGFHCVAATGRCRPNNELEGRPCTSDAQCEPYVVDRFLHPLFCDSGTCAKQQGIRLWGDLCSSSAQCQTPLTCQSGRCENPGISCGVDAHCPPEQQCSTSNECVATAFNGPCSVDDECRQSQVCNVVSSRCVNTFSLSGACNGERSRDYGCAGGTQCIPTSPSNRACSTPAPPPSTCNPLIELECNNAYACLCNATSSVGVCTKKQIESSCALQWRTFQRCAEEAECRSETEFAFEGTCVRQNCLTEFANVMICEDPIDEFTDSPECRILERAAFVSGIDIPPPEDDDDEDPGDNNAAASLWGIF